MISVIWPSVINGIAISFIFVPLTTTTMSQLAQQQIGNASGLYNLMRNLGGSIGIAFVTTAARARRAGASGVDGRPSHAHRSRVRPPASSHPDFFGASHDPASAKSMAYATIYNTLDQQAHLWAFVDVFVLFGFLALGGIPMMLLFKKVKSHSKPSPSAH